MTRSKPCPKHGSYIGCTECPVCAEEKDRADKVAGVTYTRHRQVLLEGDESIIFNDDITDEILALADRAEIMEAPERIFCHRHGIYQFNECSLCVEDERRRIAYPKEYQ